jgi:hypothetical protein
MRGVFLLVLALAAACSKKEPITAPSKPSGLRLTKSKRTPESLAQEFQKTLAINDSEALMKLSLLGQGVKNWKIIASAQNARTLKLRESELAEISKTPGDKRSEKDQARFFALHSEIEKIKKTSSDEYWQSQKDNLPALRRQFTEKSYLKFILTMNDAGINPDQVELGNIDTSRITKNYLEAGLHGGTILLHYNTKGKTLETGITYDCVEFPDEGWLIVGQPRVVRHTVIGPQPKSGIEEHEPFAAPAGE